ncbi:MAG: hypothetical protein HZB55_24595 [Deltaproteobacteria bacterium]|nr:hypothetical protein [Deltaproteobacteria bacterium]
MILNPAILALFVSSALISGMLVFSSSWAVVLLRTWDLRSGSELQLSLERRTYLLSTILNCVFAFQLLSLFLFLVTADRLCPLFAGAMCAAGTLNANGFGYPTVLLKIVNFLLAGAWLVLHHADTWAYDYPLLKAKYALLLVLTPLVLVEAFLQAGFFLNLQPDLITSCCGSLFGDTGKTLASNLASFPIGPMRLVFFGSVAVTLGLGAWHVRTGAGSYLFAASSLGTFVVSVAALLSFVSIYIYELPTHHCPFCILQSGYHSIGYPIYLALLGGAVFGLGVGILAPFRKVPSLAVSLPALQRRLALLSCFCYAAFAAVAAWKMVFTDFRP